VDLGLEVAQGDCNKEGRGVFLLEDPIPPSGLEVESQDISALPTLVSRDQPQLSAVDSYRFSGTACRLRPSSMLSTPPIAYRTTRTRPSPSPSTQILMSSPHSDISVSSDRTCGAGI
jgi:hypothetical protein